MKYRARSALALTPILFSLVMLTAPAVADDSVPEHPTLTAEVVADLKAVTSVALSPGADRVAYTLDVQRAEKDDPGRSYSELWLAPTAGGEPRHFAGHKERVSSPAWSPDGKLLSFLAKREHVHDGTQIHAIPVDGGEARLLTRHDGSVTSHAWSPDGKQIAYAARDGEDEEKKKEKEAGKDWKVFHSDPKFRHLWVLDVASSESRRLFDTDLDAHGIRWMPDGESILFQAATTAQIDDEYMRTGIYRVPAAGGEPEIVTPTIGKLGEMAISPDGEHLAYLGATSLNDPLAQSLFVVALAGATGNDSTMSEASARNLTEGFDGSGARVTWHDSETIVLLAVEGERQALYHVNLSDGGRTAVDWPRLIIGDLDYDGERGIFAASASSPEHPPELFVVVPEGEAPRRLSRHNPVLDGIRLARQEVIHWTGPGKMPISGVLTYPLDYEPGARYPLVLQVHGGPEGVSLDGWTTRPGYPVQLLARNGYAVLQPNYRGSQGQGVAFSKADHDDLGGAEFEDILAGVDSLVLEGLVDPDRVGTGGWSYGGYMSAWAATRHSDRFRASVVAAGLTNWIAFAGTTDIPYEMSLVHWNSWWFDEPELHWQRSPIAHIDNAKTPTLVVTGAKDERVHPEQAMELYTALRIKGVPTELVFYPREPHGLRERAHQIDFIERTLGWFDKYLSVPEVGVIEETLD